MSIKPPIKCPPDYSILAFRITECKKAGIVKGVLTQLAVDLQDLFVPVTNYSESMLNLKAGETKKIDVSSIAINWPLNETYEFTVDPLNCGIGTEHSYTLYSESLAPLGSFSFTVVTDFITDLQAAFAATTMTSMVSFINNDFVNTGKFKVVATDKNTKYRHEFSFDNSGFGGYMPFPFLHSGTLITPAVKYPNGRIKLLMIYPDFYKADVKSNCGCIDPSGDMMSNKKYVEYAYDDDYQNHKDPSSPITITPAGGTTYTWLGSDDIGYHFKVGDLVSTSQDPLLRGFITLIDGHTITLDTAIGNGDPNQNLNHVYSPSAAEWRKLGDFHLHTTGQDVTDDDRLMVETLWLKNPHQYDLPIRILMAS
jgi:hypothetical protein